MANGGVPFLLPPGTVAESPIPSNAPVEPAQRKGFPYTNRAVVVIDGQEYFEWETVSVRLAIRENPANTFRFTCSEKTPTPKSWSAMRIIPGQKCEIFLDGFLAITGEVVTRTVFYDANAHTVEIQGQGRAGRLNEGTVVSSTGQWTGIDFTKLAKAVTQPFGLGVMGTAQSAMKFPRVAVQQGETAWEFLERHARAAKTDMGETKTGDLWLSPSGGGASVIEGYNILVGREIIHSLKSVGSGEPGTGGEGSDFKTVGQAPGNDDSWGADPTHQRQAESPAITTDFNKGWNPKMTLSEGPAWSNDQMQDRSKFESGLADTVQIWVTCTLLTWQRSGKVPPSGGLWVPGQQVTVRSPMLVLYGRTLKLKAVTFTQDNSTGTRSTIELVNALALGGEPQAVAPPETADATGGGQQESPARRTR